MSWPTTPVPTTNLDSDADSPKLARPDILAMAQAVNLMMTEQLPAGQVPVSAVLPPGIGPLPYSGSTAPSGWVFCYGQELSRTTAAALFAVIGTAYGEGDGSTTFNVPDMRGRIAAGKDDMGGTAAGRLTTTITGTRASTSSGVITGLSSTAALAVGMAAFGTGIGTSAVISSIDSSTQVTLSVNSTTTGAGSIRFAVVDGATLGASGGASTHTMITAQIPAHTHTITALSARNTASGGTESVADSQTNTTLTTNSTGGGQAHPNVQPTLITNYIIKT